MAKSIASSISSLPEIYKPISDTDGFQIGLHHFLLQIR